MSAVAPSQLDLPPPETPTSVQPGGFGFFVRMELLWGRIRRAILRRFRPGHVAYWQKKKLGDPTRRPEVIDPRDLKFTRNVAECWFDSADDVYRRRESLGFARYGFAELVGFGVIFGLASAACSYLAVTTHWIFLIASATFLFIWLEVLWFFRDPERMIPSDPLAVLSPADGTVTEVETIEDADLGPKTLRISVFLSIFNVHVNRVPRSAAMIRAQYFPGRFLDARHPDCAKQNEQLWVDFRDRATGATFRVKQISGAIARRIVCWLRDAEEVTAGDRYGMIKFGSRTDFLVAADRIAEVKVKVGDKVRGGVTILATWHN